MNNPEFIKQLKLVFVGKPPHGRINASVDDESAEDTEAFRRRDWRDLNVDVLEKHQAALFWFTPEAFHFYLPAFLRASVNTANPNAIYVHTILQLMTAGFSDARWRLFSEREIAVLQQWMIWLEEEAGKGNIFQDVVADAARSLREYGYA